jgi:uncharacterized membrane protein YdjX (TVP38/TMEM64 family)
LLRWEDRLPDVLRRVRRRLEHIVGGAQTATFWTLFVIYATPIAAGPLRLIAAASGYSLVRFSLAIGLGVLPYNFVLATIGHTIRVPVRVYVVLAVVVLSIALIGWWVRRRRKP